MQNRVIQIFLLRSICRSSSGPGVIVPAEEIDEKQNAICSIVPFENVIFRWKLTSDEINICVSDWTLTVAAKQHTVQLLVREMREIITVN